MRRRSSVRPTRSERGSPTRPPPGAAAGRSNPYDEDIVDPLGMPLETYRAIAWELDDWIDRLLVGLFGPVPAGVAGEGT